MAVAARLGGGDPQGNPRLRIAIEKAKEANMPLENIKRAIQRGTGELPGVSYEEAIYEGYGPGGIAVLIEAMTDNKNRTISEIRHLFSKYGGNIGEAGCVSWMFEKKGYILIDKKSVAEETLMSLILEAGAEDMKTDDEDNFEIITAPYEMEKVKSYLTEQKINISLAEVTMVPKSYVKLDGKEAEQMARLMDVLEDHDDIHNVYANFDIPDEAIAKVGR